MIIGIGVDIVDVTRFTKQLKRTPRLEERLFVENERNRHPRSLAARFAAKEALIKAMGGSTGFRWHDIQIIDNEERKPGFVLRGRAHSAAVEQGISTFHLSMTHDGNIACAFVVAERII
jgi:holo-[acyl-carrier protein] synthase